MNQDSIVSELKVLIVAEHASLRFGGEAALPLHYFRVLRHRNMSIWLLVHERTRPELTEFFPADGNRIFYIPDSSVHRFLWRLEALLPARLYSVTFGFFLRYLTQLSQRREIRRIIREHGISVIHQPIPVSPKGTLDDLRHECAGGHRPYERRHGLPAGLPRAAGCG